MSAVDPCIFCEKFSTFHSFGPLLNKALYSKYSSSQNYFYSKEINDIIDSASTAAVVAYKDLEMLNEEEEYLKRGYPSQQICRKMMDLTEYYKYHKDIPRLFMPSIGSIMNRYHDKRRRIEYGRIKKELNLETSEHEDKNEAKDENETNREEDEDDEDEEEEEEEKEIQEEGENEDNKDKNDKRNDKNKQERKKKNLEDALNQCENLLVNLEITSSFHERTKGMPPRIVGKYSPRTDFNPFYMHCNSASGTHKSRKNQDHEQSGDSNFDLSSFLHKLNNSSFFNQRKQQQQSGQVQQPQQKRQLPANFNYQFEQKSTSNKQQQQQLGQTREPTSYALSILIQQPSSTTEQAALKQFYSSELSLSNMSFILGKQSQNSNNNNNNNNEIIGLMFSKHNPNNNNNIAAYNVAGQHTKLPSSLVKKKQDAEENSNKLLGNQLKNHIQPKGKQQAGTTGTYSKVSLAQQSTRLSAEGYPTADSNNSKNNVMISNIFANRTTNSELSQIILLQKQSLEQQKEAELDKLTGIHQNQRLQQLQQLEQSQKDQQMQAGFDQRRNSNIDLEEQLTFEDFKNNGLPQQMLGISKTISMPEKKNNHHETTGTNYQAAVSQDGSKEQRNSQQYTQNKQSLDQHRVQNYQNTYNKSNSNNNNGQNNMHCKSTNGSISSTSQKILQKRSSDQGNNNIYASQTAMTTAAAAVQSSQVASMMAGMQSAAQKKTNLSLQNSQQGYQHNMDNQKNDMVSSNGGQQEYNSLAQGGLYYPNGDKNKQSNSNNNNLLVFFNNNNNNTFNQNYASVHAAPAVDAGTSYQPSYHSNNASSSQISLAQQYQSNGTQQLSSQSQLQSLQQQLTHKSSIEGNIPGRYQTADRERMQIDRRELIDKGSFSNNQLVTTPAPIHKGSPSHNDSLKNHRQQQQQPQQSMSQRHSRDQLFSTSKDSQLLKQLNLLSPLMQSAQQLQENQYKVVSQIKNNNNNNTNLLSSRPRSSLHAASASITTSSSQMRQQPEQAKIVANNTKETHNNNSNSHSESTSLVRSNGSQNSIVTRIENSNNFLGNTSSQVSSQQPQQALLAGQSKQQMSLSQANINASNSNNQNYYSNDHSNNSRSLTPGGLNLGISDGQRYQQSNHTSSQQSSYQPISQVQYQQQQLTIQQQQQQLAPERSYRNNSQTMSNGDLRIKKRKEGQTFLGGNSNHGISNASSMISAFGSSSKSNSTAVTVSSSRNNKQNQHQQPQQQSSQQQSSSQLLLLLQNPLQSQSKQQLIQQQQQSHTNNEKNSFYSSLQVSPQLSFNSTNQGQLLLQQNPSHKQQQQQSHSNNFFNSKRTCNNNTGNAELIRTQQVFSKGSNAIMGTISQKNRSSSNPKNYKQLSQQQQILGQGIIEGVQAPKNQIDSNNHGNQQINNMFPLSSSSNSTNNRLQQQHSMGQQSLHEIASSLVLSKQSSANQQNGQQQQLLALQNQQLQQQNYQQQRQQQQQQNSSANNATSTARGKAMSTHFSESIKRFVDSNSNSSSNSNNNIKDSLGSPGSVGQPLLLSSSQSSGRTDSFHTRVSNIASIFDSSSALQQQQQQQLLQQSSSQQQLINNVQAYKTQYQNNNNTNNKQQQQVNQLSSNNIQNSKLNTNQYNSQHLQILQNSNISGNGNYPQSARVPLLNIKTSTNRHNQQVISLSRNNSPNKSQSSNENFSAAATGVGGGGGFQSDQTIDVQKSRITTGFNSPSQSSGINIINQGNTGNNMAQYKQIQQQGSASNSTSRAGSTQRAATKASSLIRFRQNP